MDHLLRNNGGELPLHQNMVGFQAPRTKQSVIERLAVFFTQIDRLSVPLAPELIQMSNRELNSRKEREFRKGFHRSLRTIRLRLLPAHHQHQEEKHDDHYDQHQVHHAPHAAAVRGRLHLVELVLHGGYLLLKVGKHRIHLG